MNTQDSAEAQSRLAEIQARQRQAVSAGSHPPRWFVFALAGMLAVVYLAAQQLDGMWGTVVMTAGFLAGMGGLTLLLTRRVPVQVHPSQYVRSRFWLTMAGSGVVMAVIVMVMNALTPAGLPRALAVAGAYLLVVPVMHRVSHRWALRRGPATSKDSAAADPEEVTR